MRLPVQCPQWATAEGHFAALVKQDDLYLATQLELLAINRHSRRTVTCI
jgi:hypothetical protein